MIAYKLFPSGVWKTVVCIVQTYLQMLLPKVKADMSTHELGIHIYIFLLTEAVCCPVHHHHLQRLKVHTHMTAHNNLTLMFPLPSNLNIQLALFSFQCHMPSSAFNVTCPLRTNFLFPFRRTALFVSVQRCFWKLLTALLSCIFYYTVSPSLLSTLLSPSWVYILMAGWLQSNLSHPYPNRKSSQLQSSAVVLG